MWDAHVSCGRVWVEDWDGKWCKFRMRRGWGHGWSSLLRSSELVISFGGDPIPRWCLGEEVGRSMWLLYGWRAGNRSVQSLVIHSSEAHSGVGAKRSGRPENEGLETGIYSKWVGYWVLRCGAFRRAIKYLPHYGLNSSASNHLNLHDVFQQWVQVYCNCNLMILS